MDWITVIVSTVGAGVAAGIGTYTGGKMTLKHQNNLFIKQQQIIEKSQFYTDKEKVINEIIRYDRTINTKKIDPYLKFHNFIENYRNFIDPTDLSFNNLDKKIFIKLLANQHSKEKLINIINDINLKG